MSEKGTNFCSFPVGLEPETPAYEAVTQSIPPPRWSFPILSSHLLLHTNIILLICTNQFHFLVNLLISNFLRTFSNFSDFSSLLKFSYFPAVDTLIYVIGK